MQQSLMPIQIVQQTPANYGSADLRVIGLADDGFQYALKRLEDHPLLPITEWTGYNLSRAIGLFTPDFAPVWLDRDTPAFGSRMEPVEQLGLPLDHLRIAKNFGPEARAGIEPIFAVDSVLGNDDRHARNFLWRTTVVGPVPLAFDFSRAWLVLAPPFGPFPLGPGCGTMQMWAYLKASFGYSAPAEALKKIKALPDEWLHDVLRIAPPQWVAGFDVKPTIDYWVQHRHDRCDYALSHL